MLGVGHKKVPKVLFIRNVFIDDCTSADITSKLLNTDSEAQTVKHISGQSEKNNLAMNCTKVDHTQYELVFKDSQAINYDQSDSLIGLTDYSFNKDYCKIPKVFESLETWPKSTNLHCWYCSNQFNNSPLFIPLVIEPNIHTKNGDKYLIEVESNICKWQCGISLIRETTKNITKAIEKTNNLYFLYKLLHGEYPVHIPEAPSKYLLKQFGGDYTTDQYYKLYNSEEYGII
jgi:hypothetical protein